MFHFFTIARDNLQLLCSSMLAQCDTYATPANKQTTDQNILHDLVEVIMQWFDVKMKKVEISSTECDETK